MEKLQKANFKNLSNVRNLDKKIQLLDQDIASNRIYAKLFVCKVATRVKSVCWEHQKSEQYQQKNV